MRIAAAVLNTQRHQSYRQKAERLAKADENARLKLEAKAALTRVQKRKPGPNRP